MLAAAQQASAREHLVTLEGLNEAVDGAGPVAVDARGLWPGEHPGLWPWMHGARGQQRSLHSVVQLSLGSLFGNQGMCNEAWLTLWPGFCIPAGFSIAGKPVPQASQSGKRA